VLKIDAKDLGIKYAPDMVEVTPSFDMQILFERLNYSPLIQKGYLSPEIDP